MIIYMFYIDYDKSYTVFDLFNALFLFNTPSYLTPTLKVKK